jgi:hypothetical protein
MATLVREELPQLQTEESWLLPRESAPAIAAWLLPVAERVAPDLCGELFWRSLALRRPRPRRNGLDDRVERTDIELAKLLSRYDRETARALLEPLIAKASVPSSVEVPTARWLGPNGLFLAAVNIDPRWANTLLDTVDNSPSLIELADNLRFHFVYALALPLRDRWNGPNEFAVGFWKPSARDRQLPP